MSVFSIVAEAYAEAVQDGAMDVAQVLLDEMESIAGLAERDRIESETAKYWRVG